jgi:aminopeptidase N
MDFEVEIAKKMGGSHGLFGYFDDVLVLDTFYPTIPVYDDEGWNVEIPSTNGDPTYYDASFYLVRVSAPESLTLISSGVEVGRESDEGNQIITFAAGPARDYYLAGSEHFTHVSDEVGETTINSYALEDRAESAEQALQYAMDAISSFNERFGLYPYTEFDLASTPMTALGIEYPGIVGISLSLYDPEAIVSGLPAPVIQDSVVAHEVAHQWFYNVVGNDQVDEPWLDEAMAQYATALYFDDTYGPEASNNYRSYWASSWGRVDQADIPIGLPAADYEETAYSPIVYGRGPIFLEELSREMGQDAFDQFLRDYYQTHKWGISTTDSFRELAETHCQCDLGKLFEDWVSEK